MTERTTERLLHALKSAGPQEAAVLAQRLGITPAATRQHLDALAGAGLVRFIDRRAGVGRPKRQWRLSEAGHARFPDSHAALTLDLLRATEAVFGAAGLERLIAHREAATLALYRGRLARCRGLAAKVADLTALRNAEGYMAEWRREPDGSLLLIENHCPIFAAARACQGLCRSELAVFSAAMGEAARIERIDHTIAGARRCAYRITGRPAARHDETVSE